MSAAGIFNGYVTNDAKESIMAYKNPYLGVTVVSVLVAVYGAVRATTREHVDDATKQTNILSDIKTAQASRTDRR